VVTRTAPEAKLYPHASQNCPVLSAPHCGHSSAGEGGNGGAGGEAGPNPGGGEADPGGGGGTPGGGDAGPNLGGGVTPGGGEADPGGPGGAGDGPGTSRRIPHTSQKSVLALSWPAEQVGIAAASLTSWS